MMTDVQSHEEYQKGYCDGQKAERFEIARKLIPHLPLNVAASVTGLTMEDMVKLLGGNEVATPEREHPKTNVGLIPMRKRSVRASRIVTPDCIPVSPQRAELQRKVRGLVNRVGRAKRNGR